jgi:hypothetical protein
MSRPPSPERKLDWPALLDTALTAPGNTGNAYSRFHNYSFMNRINLLMQGCPLEPVASYRRWQSLGRQVLKGSKAFEVIRPIIVSKKDANGDKTDEKFLRFKAVKGAFPVSMTEGEPLPPLVTPEWDEDLALKTLDIKRVPFKSFFDGNTAGYSYDRNIAISPVAPFPQKTLFHECAHVVSGHTAEGKHDEYVQHRGVFEFEAEGSAFLAMNELELLTPDAATVSRGYVQNWLQGQTPPESSIRTVFKTTEVILAAGRIAVGEAEAAA